MLSIFLHNYTNLPLIQKKIEAAAEKGVEAATQETVEWVKDEVIRGGNYVGNQHYPDVTDATKRSKARRGKTHVLIDTSNYLSSWDGEVDGLVGTITGGGDDYHAKLHKQGWRIDLLYEEAHIKTTEDIIKKAIEKAI